MFAGVLAAPVVLLVENNNQFGLCKWPDDYLHTKQGNEIRSQVPGVEGSDVLRAVHLTSGHYIANMLMVTKLGGDIVEHVHNFHSEY